MVNVPLHKDGEDATVGAIFFVDRSLVDWFLCLSSGIHCHQNDIVASLSFV